MWSVLRRDCWDLIENLMISITSVCVGRIRVDIISCWVVWVLGGGTPDQLPHIYYHLLSSGSLLSPSLGKFQPKCLTNLRCQSCCYTKNFHKFTWILASPWLPMSFQSKLNDRVETELCLASPSQLVSSGEAEHSWLQCLVFDGFIFSIRYKKDTFSLLN